MNTLRTIMLALLCALAFLITLDGLVTDVFGQEPARNRLEATQARAATASGLVSHKWYQDWRLWSGIALTASAVEADQITSRAAERRGGVESNKFLRDSNGHLNRGKEWLVWGGINALLIPADIKPRYRWVSFGARAALSMMWFRLAAHNRGVLR